MASMEMSDMPMAVLKAVLKTIWRDRTIVSKTIDVRIPLTIASSMIQRVGQVRPVTWKNNIVPQSPIEQPVRHQSVFFEARGHV
jgi:hypothetical protein